MGETIENVSKNIDTYSYRQPLGVCAGVAPFNFPAMIPMYARTPLHVPLFLTGPSAQVDVPPRDHLR